ncbi:MAG: hypothetical protein IJT49_10090 [Clostridia bacterium]|nr:hypothetical protein [Clostridia bacterium]
MKKAFIYVIICAVVISVFSAVCAAENGVDYGDGVIKNVVLSNDGVLRWDPYDKAEDYWIGINGGFTPASIGMNLKDLITETGTYRIDLEAYAEEGEKFIAAWSDKIVYDGSVFKLESYTEQTTAEETTEEITEETTEETQEQTSEEETEEGTEALTEEETFETQTERTETASEKTETEAEAETEEKSTESKGGGAKWMIAGICIGVAVTAVVAVLIVQKKAKGK